MLETIFENTSAIVSAVSPTIEKMGQDKKKDIKTIAEQLTAIGKESVKVLVCGEFKRGKSSFVNALLGRKLCAVDQDICTAAVSIIRYGEKEKVVRYYGKLSDPKHDKIEFEDITKYTSAATDEAKDTIYMDICLPLPYLKDGLVIIDTPGVGGMAPRHALLTNFFLPQADITLFMTDTKEPLTTTELEFYDRKVRRYSRHSMVILNKSDMKERGAVEEMRKDTARKIADYCKKNGNEATADVIAVSSRKKLMFDKNGMETLYADSNFMTVENKIRTLAEDYEKERIALVCSNLYDLLCRIIDPMKTQLENIEMPDPKKIEEIRTRQMEIQKQIQNLNDPTSEFRTSLQNKTNEMREEVINNLNQQSIFFSTSAVNKLLERPEAKGANAEKWVTKQINDGLSSMTAEITMELQHSFENIAAMPEFAGMLNYSVKDIQLSVNALGITGEVPIHRRLMSMMPGVGIGFITNTAIGAAIGFLGLASMATLAPIAGIAMGLGIAFKSQADVQKNFDCQQIRTNLQPQITAATQQLRTYVETRFNEFQQNWVRVVSERAKNAAADMQQLSATLNKWNNDHKTALSAKMGIERIVTPLDSKRDELKTIMENIGAIRTVRQSKN